MLPSQSARSSYSRSHMYRRRKRRGVPVIVGVIVVVVAGVASFKIFRKAAPDVVNAAPTLSPTVMDAPVANPSTNRTAASTPVTPRQEPAPPVNNPPATANPPVDQRITMGSSTTNNPPVNNPPATPPVETQAKKPSPSPAATNQPQSQPQNQAQNPPPTQLASAPKTSPELPRTTTSNNPAPTSTATSGAAAQRIDAGMTLLAQNKPIDARRTLTAALMTPGLSTQDAERVRGELTRLNQRLVFSPEVVAGDPFASYYTIEPNDALARLPRKLGLNVDWRFLQRINNISAPERLQVGQRIKVVKGPFHAIVHKREYRMDLFMGSGSERVFVRSFRVGLGEHGTTPEGVFIVKPNSKLINPAWTNPRTGEHFSADDPKNPLGEYWIGLIGFSDNIRGLETYGVHGTIEPDSIGQSRSMGCVRMLHDDVALMYELLIDNVSQVEIHGDDYP